MATLDQLKRALVQKAAEVARGSQRKSLTSGEYEDGFSILMRDPGRTTYRDFIIPQLASLLTPLLKSRHRVSVLEIGPGPESVLGYLPEKQRRKIGQYTAFEPNDIFASKLKTSLISTSDRTSVLPCLTDNPDIRQEPFTLESAARDTGFFDVVLFCHSMYGMRPKR